MSNKKLQKKVKELRARVGYSQELVAEKSGLSLRTIQRIENGETEPHGETLKRLAVALNVTPEELIEWEQTEDNSYLYYLNLSALSFFLFPVLGIIVPLVLWANKKDKIKNVYKTGAEILNFQITWNIIFFITFLLFLLLRMVFVFNAIEIAGHISPAIIANSMKEVLTIYATLLFFLYAYNLIFIIVNSVRIIKRKSIKYFPRIRFIR
jgi:uncharacterized Tic20 family protein